MIDGKRKVSDLTLDELLEGMASKKEDETVTTDELCEVLKCSPQQIGRYGRLGMYKFRIKKDCWLKSACKKWVANEYQAMLKTKKIKAK
jgi:hypothetical protein